MRIAQDGAVVWDNGTHENKTPEARRIALEIGG